MPVTTESFELTDGSYTRRVWLWQSGATEVLPLCVFLDAEFYLERINALAILDDLSASGAIPPVNAVFVSHGDGEARHYDYTCSVPFSAFITETVIPWAAEHSGSMIMGENLICGLSLSGLASAYLILTRPDLFSGALCQSGSFWWKDEWLTTNLPTFSAVTGRFWLSVGDQETSAGVSHPPTGLRQDVCQRDAVGRFARALEQNGATMHLQEFSGGHEMAPWQQELPAALEYLLAPRTPPEISSAERP